MIDVKCSYFEKKKEKLNSHQVSGLLLVYCARAKIDGSRLIAQVIMATRGEFYARRGTKETPEHGIEIGERW